MKKLFSYLNIAALFILLSSVFAACTDNETDGPGVGLNIKVFAPTVVVPGQSMTINGSGFEDVVEIVFPGDIKVTNFEIITDEMIRVAAPAELAEAGNIMVRNAAGETAVSRLPLTLGHTEIMGYSAQEGDTIKGNETLTIYGKDMQFVKGAEFIDEDGNIILVPASEFVRVATGRVVIQVPAKVLTGVATVRIMLADGRIVETPEYAFETAKNSGHWEYNRRFIWENKDGVTPSWNGVLRICEEGHDFNNECCAELDESAWNSVKESEVFFLFEGNESSNIRITTGWWTGAYGGNEHNCIDMAEVDEETGKMVIKLNIKEDGNLYGNIDEQHLLFTGSDYTPIGLYVLEAVWVEGGGHYETVRTSFWKNGVQSTIPAPSWSGEGRFCCVANSTGEETYAFSEEEWAILKSEPFRIAIEKTADWANIRVTDGWWQANYMGMENLQDLIETAEDGTLFIEINLANDAALLEKIDAQHLLFTGDGYKLLEIYQEKEVWVDGDEGPQEVVLWENDGSHGAASWDGVYRFCNEEHVTGEQIHSFTMDEWSIIKDGIIYVLLDVTENPNIRVTTGWWTGAYGGNEHNCIDMCEDHDSGKKVLMLNIKEEGSLYGNIDEQHLLFTGDGYTPLKIYYYK